MQSTEASQICWTGFFNRDPTPSSAFWPPLHFEYPKTQDGGGAATANGDRACQRPRREVYVFSVPDQDALDYSNEERHSLRSLKQFLEKGIGLEALLANVATPGSSSIRTVPQSSAPLPQRTLTLVSEASACSGGSQEDESRVSPLSMLWASRVSTRSLAVRHTNGAAGVDPQARIELLSLEKNSKTMSSKQRRGLIERRKGNWFATKTTYSDIRLAIKGEARKVRLVLEKIYPYSRRLQSYKRRRGIGPYYGT